MIFSISPTSSKPAASVSQTLLNGSNPNSPTIKLETQDLFFSSQSAASSPAKEPKDIFRRHYRPFSEFVGKDKVTAAYLSHSLSKINQEVNEHNNETSLDSIRNPDDNLAPKKSHEVNRWNSRISYYSSKFTDQIFSNQNKIFDFFAIVQVDATFMDESLRNLFVPQITHRYPRENGSTLSASVIRNIPLFCFPELGVPNSVNADDYSIARNTFRNYCETFNFILTEQDHKKKYGYCKRVSEANSSEISVLCIVSSFHSNQIFYDILNIAEKFHGDAIMLDTLFENLWLQIMPRPGSSIELVVNRTKYAITNPIESVSSSNEQIMKLLGSLGIIDLKSLTHTNLNFMKLVSLLNSLILERRIIFVSNSLQKLSECCNAAVSLIYPLEWQHIFIPVLPRRLAEFVCSPTPFIIGMLSADLSRIMPNGQRQSEFQLENVFIYDLDACKILRNDIANSDKIIPPYLLALFKGHLEVFFESPKPEMDVSSVFLKLFFLILGSYRKHVEVDVCSVRNASVKDKEDILSRADSTDFLQRADRIKVWFNFASFIAQHPLLINNPPITSSKRQISAQQQLGIRLFLTQLQNLQNFQYFVQEREEALQFHYQQQLSSSRQLSKQASQLSASSLESSKCMSAGMKSYYWLAQSKFEKIITSAEVQATPSDTRQ